MFVYELSGYGVGSSCSHLILYYHRKKKVVVVYRMNPQYKLKNIGWSVLLFLQQDMEERNIALFQCINFC